MKLDLCSPTLCEHSLGQHLAAKTSAVDLAGTKAWGFTQYGVPEIWYGTEWLGGDPTIGTTISDKGRWSNR